MRAVGSLTKPSPLHEWDLMWKGNSCTKVPNADHPEYPGHAEQLFIGSDVPFWALLAVFFTVTGTTFPRVSHRSFSEP